MEDGVERSAHRGQADAEREQDRREQEVRHSNIRATPMVAIAIAITITAWDTLCFMTAPLVLPSLLSAQCGYAIPVAVRVHGWRLRVRLCDL
jgi:hypothetical protein